MIRRIARIFISLLGMLIGYTLTSTLFDINILAIDNASMRIVVYVINIIFFGLIMFALSERIIRRVMWVLDRTESVIGTVPPADIAFGATGLLFGLILSFFISAPLRGLFVNLPFGSIIGMVLTVLIYLILGTLGARFVLRYKDDILRAFQSKAGQGEQDKKRGREKRAANQTFEGMPKILDTSVLIDGRILHIVETGFIDGPLVIAEFVLEELQYIADSTDDLKRERGRRGLDIVNELKESNKISLQITDQNYDDVNEVDIKLLKLTQDLNGKIMTNDYNLNKVASVQDIPVLNVNDLANAVKTIVIPGEKMHVSIIKEGKEKRQGLAYLEDGTMIVVEDAKDLIGQDIQVAVTTVLQTAAGKMIFAKPL